MGGRRLPNTTTSDTLKIKVIKEITWDVAMVNKSIARHGFGWVLEPIRFEYDGLAVEPMQNFQEVNEFNLTPLRTEQWIFIPHAEIPEPFSAFFTLMCNHEMIVEESQIDVRMADRLIAVLGFLIGVPLCPTGMGHIYKVPYRRGALAMFKTTDEELGRCLSAATRFYKSASHKVAGLMDAAIHWHLAAQCQNYLFERFAWQYSALDNIHCLLEEMDKTYNRNGGHKYRPINIRIICALHCLWNFPIRQISMKMHRLSPV